MDSTLVLPVAAFVVTVSLVLMTALILSGHPDRLAVRVRGLSQEVSPGESKRQRTRGQIGRVIPTLAAPLVPHEKAEQNHLRTRIVQAGLYGQNAYSVFLSIKSVLTFAPVILGLVAGAVGWVSPTNGLLGGLMVGVAGMIGTSFWLDSRKKSRQLAMRRSLPDGVDLMVVCLEGGTSLQGALHRVTHEIRLAHPLLAAEWTLVIRGMEMGQLTGEALRQLADRFDMEELRRLASIVVETERFGTSVSKALRIHAEIMRLQRQQRAEEQARKAEVKLIIPTVLFILPCIFVVVLYPSFIHISRLFDVVGGPQ